MPIRYSTEFLIYLRDSPLCKKPDGLPPAEEWMGPPTEPGRPQHQQRGSHNFSLGSFDKPRSIDSPLIDQANRRPGVDRHMSRNSATSHDDIVFGPPRMAFASSTRGSQKPLDEKTPKDGDVLGRFSGLRSRNGEANSNRRRGDASENDSEGWSTVKPRKSFGTEGAERFHGRMGASFRHDKKPSRDKDDNTLRPFDALSALPKNKDGEEEGRPRNGLRNKTDPWRETAVEEGPTTEKRERMDRAKSWRERNPATEVFDDHGATRSTDRRWGRDQHPRVEREPEWLDEPVEQKPEARTQQDFQKWMEEMKRAKGGSSTSTMPGAASDEPAPEASKPPLRSPPGLEAGPDKFFMAFGAKPGDVTSPGEQADTAAKNKPAAKSSRFTSFFQSQDDGRGRVEAAVSPLASLLNGGNVQPPHQPQQAPVPNLLQHLQQVQQQQPQQQQQQHQPPQQPASAAPDDERQAFQQLLAKLQKQSMSNTPPANSPFPVPGHNNPPDAARSTVTSASPFQQMQGERRDGPVGRPPPQSLQEILAPRPQQQSARPDQLIQDLVGHQRVSSQGSTRNEVNNPARHNSNTEFLMNLMRGNDQRPDSASTLMRLAQQGAKQGPPPMSERDAEYARDVPTAAPRQMRGPPPGFPFDDAFRGGDGGEPRPGQPTQILQRPPPPPGLDQMPQNWMPGGGQMPPPPPQQQQPPPQQPRGPMLPPPGLAAGPGPGRNPPLPHMFPPNFPPGAMPPPEAMASMPPRNMGPPPGFFNNLPPGFMPPGIPGYNGPPGPEPHGAFAGSPFEARGMPPPPSAGGRGASNFGRN